jgi:hypothetical protein
MWREVRGALLSSRRQSLRGSGGATEEEEEGESGGASEEEELGGSSRIQAMHSRTSAFKKWKEEGSNGWSTSVEVHAMRLLLRQGLHATMYLIER